jgi:tetratricopeptide (TPR) repeat protein
MSAYIGRLVVVTAAVALVTFAAANGSAQERNTSTREAAKHFQRGVALYGEADYRGALVEFKRAYAITPNTAVLYNVGETEFQLQDYAGALTTFERYAAESGSSDPQHAEVENTMEVLRSRVGRVSVTTVPPGAEVTVDDRAVGKTPLDKSVLVSVGHRKVTASFAGRTPVVRYIDVAADDNQTVTLEVPGATDTTPATAQTPRQALRDDPSASHSGATLRTLGWIATGALAVGAAASGVLATREASDLRAARGEFPVSSATLDRYANLTTTYSVLADSLTGAALVLGGITLYSTLTSTSASSTESGGGHARVSVGLASARFELTF